MVLAYQRAFAEQALALGHGASGVAFGQEAAVAIEVNQPLAALAHPSTNGLAIHPLSVAIVGCGRWGPNHIRSFSRIAATRVAAAVDTQSARLDQITDMFPGLRIELDYRGVLADTDVDAVVVATPTTTHYALVRDALEAGKHVLCEKPLCESSAQAMELAELAEANRLVLMVGHVFLFNPGILKVREIVESGQLGKLYSLVAVRTNLGPIRQDVNAAYDLATHDVAIFNWLLGGPPESVSATGAAFVQPGVEDVVFISLTYPGPVFGNIHSSWLNPKKVRQISLVGSEKMVTWDDLDLNTPVAIYNKGANGKQVYGSYGEFLRLSMWDGDVLLPKVHLEEPLLLQDSYFIDAIRQGFADRSNGRFGAEVVAVLEAVAKSLKLGGQPVPVH